VVCRGGVLHLVNVVGCPSDLGAVVSAFRTDLLFWVFLFIAAGFARYFVLAVNEDDRPFAVAAAVAFVVMCVLAAAEFFGWWW
jgi:hypothetical protein